MILANKFQPPRLENPNVEHVELLASFDDTALNTIILICAPAGYGKSTLASQWMEKLNDPAGWLTLDAHDNDACHFWRHFISALPGIEDSKKNYFLSQLKQSVVNHQHSVENILAMLIAEMNKCYAKASGRQVLILDDFHHIQNKTLLKQISYLLDYASDNLTTVITSRTLPRLSLAKRKLTGRVLEIDIKALCFNLKKTQKLLNDNMGLSISNGQLGQLHGWTEGWIAGLKLAAISIKQNSDITHLLNNLSDNENSIGDYLLEEVIDNLPETDVDILIRISFLPQFNAELCDKILDSGRSRDNIDRFIKLGLFIHTLKNNGFRFHELFRKHLHEHFLKLDIDVQKNLILRASEWFENNNFHLESMDLLSSINDWNNVTRIVEDIGVDLLAEGRIEVLRRFIEYLPSSRIHQRPLLTLLEGGSYLGQHKEHLIKKKLVDAKTVLHVNKENIDAHYQNKFQLGIYILQTYLNTWQNTESKIEIEGNENNIQSSSVTCFQKGLIALDQGDIENAENNFEIAIQYAEIENNKYTYGIGSTLLIKACHRLGYFEKAKYIRHQALEYLSHSDKEWTMQQYLIEYANHSMAHEIYDLSSMNASLKPFEKLIDSDSKSELRILGFIMMAQRFARNGEFNECYLILDKVIGITGYALTLKRYQHSPIHLIRAGFLWMEGKHDLAGELITPRDLELIEKADYCYEEECKLVAQIWIAQNRLSDASVIISNMLEAGSKSKRIWTLFAATVLEASLAQKKGDKAIAILKINQALSYGEKLGYIRAFIENGKDLYPLLIEVQLTRSPSHYLSCLIQEYRKSSFCMTDAEKDDESVLKQSLKTLTKRESQILDLLSLGLSNQDISEKEFISVGTVKTHLNKIYTKLDVKSRTQAIRALAD